MHFSHKQAHFAHVIPFTVLHVNHMDEQHPMMHLHPPGGNGYECNNYIFVPNVAKPLKEVIMYYIFKIEGISLKTWQPPLCVNENTFKITIFVSSLELFQLMKRACVNTHN